MRVLSFDGATVVRVSAGFRAHVASKAALSNGCNYCFASTNSGSLWVILLSLSDMVSSWQFKELLLSCCVLQYSITIPLSSVLLKLY